MIVRKRTPGDDADWLKLRIALWPKTTAAEHRVEMDAWLKRSDAIVLVAQSEVGGGLVGFTEIGARSLADGCETSPLAYLEGWYVDTAIRRRGVGAALIEAGEAWARSHGFSEFASDAEVENTDSQKAHVALGFREMERSVLYLKKL
jgi:aminoglycoside 6'-N-acetyltransferase I